MSADRKRLSGGVQFGADAVEQVGKAAPEGRCGSDDANSDKRGDQTVFNRSRAGLVSHEMVQGVHLKSLGAPRRAHMSNDMTGALTVSCRRA